MRNYFRLSSVLTVAGALLIGALGSGLWEVLKPLLVWMGSITLSIATLGINSLRDDLYAEMAKGVVDRTGLHSANILTAIMALMFAIPAVLFPPFIRITLRKTTQSINIVRAAARKPNAHTQSPKRMVTQIRRLMTALVAIAALGAGITIVSFARVTFVTGGAIYLEQSQRILAPYLGNDQRLAFSSRAALIRSKEDFNQIQNDFIKIASANNVRLPSFTQF